jgi:ABC-type transport system involved in cytochrome bd biosynthesis fused ATPase/permease subunit
MATETIWKKLFLKDFPYTDKMINKNYKFAYKELRTYLESWYRLTDLIPLSIIGTTGSGKSTMIQRYIHGTFQLEYNPGLMEYYRYNFSI